MVVLGRRTSAIVAADVSGKGDEPRTRTGSAAASEDHPDVAVIHPRSISKKNINSLLLSGSQGCRLKGPTEHLKGLIIQMGVEFVQNGAWTVVKMATWEQED